ncbi:MAG: hypothetical protein GXY52_04985 [Chloroflexi bacterium]|mgnify:CR=1 FL=1|nr:hypothetical protein [Chloroflexota bacterium]
MSCLRKSSIRALLGAIVVCSLLLTGCDPVHQMRIENRTTKKISVGVEPLGRDFVLAGCSVRVHRWAGPPLPGKPITFTAIYAERHEPLSTTVLTATNSSDPGFVLKLTSAIDHCPGDITDRYQLWVHNQTNLDLTVAPKGQEPMLVRAGSDTLLGPYVGSISAVWGEIGIFAAPYQPKSGQLRPVRELMVEYPLGEVPTGHLTLTGELK